MEEKLIRKIQIGLMDSIPLEKRQFFIKKDISLDFILRQYPNTIDHYKDALDILRWLEKSSLNKICWFGDDDFPDFRPISRRIPYMLFYRGEFMNKPCNSISIVGTRHPDNDGFQESFKLGFEASVNGISVVSGLAEGCDQASLYGAVVGKTPSFGVLGCGLDIDYPSYSADLKKAMIESGGAVISRFPPDYPPLKQNFPNRNLIISAMSDCTVVIQAPVKSGSLITSDMTLQLGKDVYVASSGKGSSWERMGSDQLIQDGAVTIKSISELYDCRKEIIQTEDIKGVRFGNKHYFIRSIN